MAVKRKTTKAATATERQAFRKRMLQAAGAGFLLMLWGFVLGVLVGRGTLPTVVPMDKTAAGPQKPLIVAEKSPDKPKKDPDLDFYQSLAKKRQQLAEQEAAAAKAAQEKQSAKAAPAVKVEQPQPAKTEQKTAPASPIAKAEPPKIKVEPVKEAAAPVKVAPKPSPPAAKVKTPVKPPNPVSNAEAKAKPAQPAVRAEGGRWAVQVAAFRNPAEALAFAKKSSKASGLPYRVTTVKLKNKGTWHRVRLGAFQNKSEARKAARDLKSKGLSVMIVSLKS